MKIATALLFLVACSADDEGGTPSTTTTDTYAPLTDIAVQVTNEPGLVIYLDGEVVHEYEEGENCFVNLWAQVPSEVEIGVGDEDGPTWTEMVSAESIVAITQLGVELHTPGTPTRRLLVGNGVAEFDIYRSLEELPGSRDQPAGTISVERIFQDVGTGDYDLPDLLGTMGEAQITLTTPTADARPEVSVNGPIGCDALADKSVLVSICPMLDKPAQFIFDMRSLNDNQQCIGYSRFANAELD